MSSLEITALADGPYRVEGDVTLRDRDERPVPDPGSPVYLCRCGRSANKPFCDGSHARTGWTEDA
jgi:CDGSH-type Zn-finger protein